MTPDERHEDFSDEPVRCVECGGWNSPDDGDFIATPHGPICANCYGSANDGAAA